MSKILKSLDDHNNERLETAITFTSSYPRFNGIACPACGNELYDTDMSVLASIPPQKNTHCGRCNYRGYRYL